MKYTCPCCGYKTLEEESTGTYEICNICYWEDDEVQFNDLDFEGGANEVSLRQAQKNFITFGACEEAFVKSVRKPTSEDVKDASWKQVC
ncbi:CPCC family cysteine-rich protein [Bacillus mobilis]|uniref:CPCC family cysteine-rich protein n=1 Tax=Bacillus mobilis TaxID=2026190 RepID=UPI0021CDC97E|nr:CPCC family cysteine-rich protein [Bacillus mobilis]MCU5433057.1 CPCC family cysteine-rich protein [Bacillus mobilis]